MNNSYIKNTWSLKNSQYTAVLDLFKDMGFIDSSGTPTGEYAKLMTPSMMKKALGSGVQKAYSQLFKAFPNAHNLSNQELEEYIVNQTGATGSKLKKITQTFRKLVELSDMSTLAPSGTGVMKPASLPNAVEVQGAQVKVSPNIHLNVEIHIDSSTSNESIEAIFKNMHKYLIDKG